jgi:hypothetical protein
MARFVIAAFASVIIWLMFSAPTSFTAESALLISCALFGFYMVLWNDLIFDVFGGDNYTYGLVAKAVSFIGFLITLVAALRGYYLIWVSPTVSGIVSPFNWVVVMLGLFVPLWLPIASRWEAAPLPHKNSRREYEDPRQ